MNPKVFIDGEAGTTGLQIAERLKDRTDIDLISIHADKRKDVDERARLINKADVVILCLPDEAAKESVSLIENDTTRVIDASTAFRVDPNWAHHVPCDLSVPAEGPFDVAAALDLADIGSIADFALRHAARR